MIPGQHEWSALEKQRRLRVERALFASPWFVRHITKPRDLPDWRPGMPDPVWGGNTGWYVREDSRTMPWVWLICPSNNHKIIPIRLEIDPPLGATRPDGLPPIKICHRDQHRDDVLVPASSRAVHSDDDTSWPGSRTRWHCAYEYDDGADCDTDLIPWGQSFCDQHRDQPEPLVIDELYSDRLYIRCTNKGGCEHAERHQTYRYSTLLVRFAEALYLGRKKILLGR